MVSPAAWSWIKEQWTRKQRHKPPQGESIRTKSEVDGYDVCILCGFGCLMAGIAMYSTALALIIGGCLLLGLGLVGSARRDVR